MKALKAGDPYVCAACACTFLTTRDDVEAWTEFDRQWPAQRSEGVRICDDCFNAASTLITAMVGDLVRKH